MTNEGFLHRFRSGGYQSIIFGYDLLVAILGTLTVFMIFGSQLTGVDAGILVREVTEFSRSMLAVIIVGISLLAAITKVEFLKILVQENALTKLFFAFEATAMLALLTTGVGILYQIFSPSPTAAYPTIFLGLYLFGAVARLISMIVSYGRRRAMIATIDDLPDDLDDQIQQEDGGKHEGKTQ